MKKLITLALMALTLYTQQNHAAAGRFAENIGRLTEQAGSRFQPAQWMRNAGPKYDALTGYARRYARPVAGGAAGVAGVGALHYAYNNPEMLQNIQQSMTPELLSQQNRNYMYNMLPNRSTFSNMIPNRETFSGLYNNALQNENVQRTRAAFNRMYNEAAQSEMANRWKNYWTPQGGQ